jgi:hypothetical protein
MADQKITELAENTAPEDGDLLVLVDDVGGTPVTQKVLLSTIRAYVMELVESIQFDITRTGALAEGEVGWDSEDETLAVGMAGNVTLQLGQETHVRVKNEWGSQINNGTVVRISGGVGSNPLVVPADPDGEVERGAIGWVRERRHRNDHCEGCG